MVSEKNKRQVLFDNWASTYDAILEDEESFPFIGYEKVLNAMIARAETLPEHRVLDLGIGTGNCARRLTIPDEQIWGVDFSEAMLDRARLILPAAHLIKADLTGEGWLQKIAPRFDRILSAYTFHEFPDSLKIEILIKLAKHWLEGGGAIIIGDISFQNQADFLTAQEKFCNSWDEEEFYWRADIMKSALSRAGFLVKYEQISTCAGIYQLIWSGRLPDDLRH